MENLFNDVAVILADVAECEVSEITLETNLPEDLGINSLMGLEIMVMLERKFKIKLKEEDLVKMTTPDEIIALLEIQLELKEELLKNA